VTEERPNGLRLGHKVPDFELDTYEPARRDFGKFRLRDQIGNRWTILFFYPADFTFV
jgi:alkyl hydroperoxide reductase subunit AhpC